MWCLVFLAMYGAIGQMLLGSETFAQQSFWIDLRQAVGSYPIYVETNLGFVRWQMLWFYDGLAAVEKGQIWEGLIHGLQQVSQFGACLLYTSDAADERSSVDLGGRRIIKKKKENKNGVENELTNKMRKIMNEGEGNSG